jgi:hypothetical protein
MAVCAYHYQLIVVVGGGGGTFTGQNYYIFKSVWDAISAAPLTGL